MGLKSFVFSHKLFLLSSVLFIPSALILSFSGEYMGGLRDIFIFSTHFFDNFSVYSNNLLVFDSPLFNYLVVFLFYKLVPWALIRPVSLFIFYLISLFNVWLLYSFFRDKRWSFLVVPFFYFSIPAVEYSNLLLITFLLLALKFRKKHYWSALFMSLSLFTKTYALVPVGLLLIDPFFGKGFLKFKFDREKFSVFIKQSLLIFSLQLIVYFPFGLSAVFNRLFGVVGHGFNFFGTDFAFFFPMLALLVVTLLQAFNKRSNRLLFLFIFYLAMYVSQSKLGANLYYSILPACLLFQFYYSKRKPFLLLVLIFYLCFLFTYSGFLLAGPFTEPFFWGVSLIPNNTLFFGVNGFSPLLLSKSAFDTASIYAPGVDYLSYDSVVFNLHVRPLDIFSEPELITLINHFNAINILTYSGCLECNVFMTLGFKEGPYVEQVIDYYSDLSSNGCLVDESTFHYFSDWYGVSDSCSGDGLLTIAKLLSRFIKSFAPLLALLFLMLTLKK